MLRLGAVLGPSKLLPDRKGLKECLKDKSKYMCKCNFFFLTALYLYKALD